MIKSDHSEDDGNMDKLELSSESIDFTIKKKRPRIEENIDELELSDSTDSAIKRKKPKMGDYIDETKDLSSTQQSCFSEQAKILKESDEVILDKNSIDDNDIKEKKHIIYSENGQNEHGTFLCESNVDMKEEKQLKNSENQENKNKLSPLKNEDSVEKRINEKNIENEVKSSKELVENATATENTISTPENKKIGNDAEKIVEKDDNATILEEQKDKKDEIKEYIIKSETMDTEVVDGLELSVECASDKEESSFENEDEKDAKPRPKTIIVKAEPNESELECSLSEEEKSNLQEVTDVRENESEKKKTKKRVARTSFSKVKDSGSEDNQNNNSDEDYNAQIKRKVRKSSEMGRSTKRVMESRRGRGKNARNSHKKSTQHAFDNKNVDTTSEKAEKLMKDEIEEEVSEKEFSEEELSDKSENIDSDQSENINSEDEESSTKGNRKRRSNRLINIEKKSNKQIQKLKKYLNLAGIKVKQNALADCRSNAAQVKYLKELLEKNGISGRPSLKKCKQAKEKNEKIKEVSELDVSNIISEGRITRARRNVDNNRKAISLDTSPRHREARNTFKRIRTVIDSDSE